MARVKVTRGSLEGAVIEALNAARSMAEKGQKLADEGEDVSMDTIAICKALQELRASVAAVGIMLYDEIHVENLVQVPGQKH